MSRLRINDAHDASCNKLKAWLLGNKGDTDRLGFCSVGLVEKAGKAQTEDTMEYALRFVNIPDNGTHHFTTLDESISAGRRFGFEFVIERNGMRLASWSIFGGLRKEAC